MELAGGQRACEGGHWREEEEGDNAGESRRRRGASVGATEEHEVVGGMRLGEATVWVRTVARSGASLSHAMACHWLSGRVRRVWGVQDDVNNPAEALDALDDQ